MGSIVLTILFVFGKLRPLLASNLMCATHTLLFVCLKQQGKKNLRSKPLIVLLHKCSKTIKGHSWGRTRTSPPLHPSFAAPNIKKCPPPCNGRFPSFWALSINCLQSLLLSVTVTSCFSYHFQRFRVFAVFLGQDWKIRGRSLLPFVPLSTCTSSPVNIQTFHFWAVCEINRISLQKMANIENAGSTQQVQCGK